MNTLRRCAKQLTHTQPAKKGSHFFCPQHYCKICGKSGDGKDMAKVCNDRSTITACFILSVCRPCMPTLLSPCHAN